MNDQINRLGYGAWAENIVVNFLEDYQDEIKRATKMNYTLEFDKYYITASMENASDTLRISVRAYVEGNGWQILEQYIKVK